MHLNGRSFVCERSCLLRCSLLLKARLQNWHLYFLSGASEVFREAGVDAADDGNAAATLGPGILFDCRVCTSRGNRRGKSDDDDDCDSDGDGGDNYNGTRMS